MGWSFDWPSFKSGDFTSGLKAFSGIGADKDDFERTGRSFERWERTIHGASHVPLEDPWVRGVVSAVSGPIAGPAIGAVGRARADRREMKEYEEALKSYFDAAGNEVAGVDSGLVAEDWLSVAQSMEDSGDVVAPAVVLGVAALMLFEKE